MRILIYIAIGFLVLIFIGMIVSNLLRLLHKYYPKIDENQFPKKQPK